MNGRPKKRTILPPPDEVRIELTDLCTTSHWGNDRTIISSRRKSRGWGRRTGSRETAHPLRADYNVVDPHTRVRTRIAGEAELEGVQVQNGGVPPPHVQLLY